MPDNVDRQNHINGAEMKTFFIIALATIVGTAAVSATPYTKPTSSQTCKNPFDYRCENSGGG
jgi:hypothetical protein